MFPVLFVPRVQVARSYAAKGGSVNSCNGSETRNAFPIPHSHSTLADWDPPSPPFARKNDDVVLLQGGRGGPKACRRRGGAARHRRARNRCPGYAAASRRHGRSSLEDVNVAADRRPAHELTGASVAARVHADPPQEALQ